MNTINWKASIIAIVLLLPTSPAYAGWMDQVGGMLNTANNIGKSTGAPSIKGLNQSDIVAGLKDALRVGSENVVAQLGKSDGFNADPSIHIPLPDNMLQVKRALSSIGMGSMMDNLELRLNRAAEAATPKAKRVFGDSIKAMTFNDAKHILNGPKDAATQYFKKKMSAPLAKEMRPIIAKALNQAGAIQAYDNIMGKYQSLPFMPDVKANLTQHVLNLGLSGIFHYMAAEETAIRTNPAKRSTEILKKVFAM